MERWQPGTSLWVVKLEEGWFALKSLVEDNSAMGAGRVPPTDSRSRDAG